MALHRSQDLTRGRRRRRGASGCSRSRHGRVCDGSGEMRLEDSKERLLGFGEIGEDRRREGGRGVLGESEGKREQKTREGGNF